MLEEPIPLLIIKILIGIGAVYELIKFIIKFIRAIRKGLILGDKVLKEPTKRDYLLGVFYSLLCALLWSLSYVSLSYVSSKTDLLNINVALLGTGCAFLTLCWALAWLFDRETGTSPKLNLDWKTAAPWIVVAMNLAGFLLFIYAPRISPGRAPRQDRAATAGRCAPPAPDK